MPTREEKLAQAIELLSSAAQDLGEVPAPSRPGLAQLFGTAGKICAASTVHLAALTPDPGGLLAGATGTGVGVARRQLEAAAAASAVPVMEEALRHGSLSLDQASALAELAKVSATDAAELTQAALEGTSLPELKAKAARKLRAARSERCEQDRERALHARRYCRFYEQEGGVRLDAFLAGADAAKFMVALKKKTDTLARESWNAGGTETVERYRADALAALVAGEGVRTQLMVHVDGAALQRGELRDDERCEIDGIGQVSLATVRSLLPEALAAAVIRAGQDIRTISSATRVIPVRLERALKTRDRCCVVPGCGRRDGLQTDHWSRDFSAKGLTEIANLCRLCAPHHRLKTANLFTLSGGPGRWRWERTQR